MRTIFRPGLPLGVLLALTTAANVAHADASPSSSSSPGEPIIMRANEKWIHLGGVFTGAKSADLETRALAIVQNYAKASELVVNGVDHFGDGEAVVRYDQSHHGLPVIGRGAAVRLSAKGQPIMTVLDVEEQLPVDVRPTVTALSASSVASSRLLVGASASDAHLIVWPTLDRGARLAYAVTPQVPAGLAMAPRAIIDAQTGEVLEVRDMLTFVANAYTYEYNPIKTPTESNATLSLAPTGTTLSHPFIEATNCIDKKTVKPVNMFGFNLNVHICDLEQVATANGSGDFVYEPSDVAGSAEARRDAYSEVSIYYHTAKAYTFFRTLQGDAEAQVVVDKPLKLIANLQIPAGIAQNDIKTASDPNIPLETFQNAFFSPAGGGLGALFQQLYGFKAGALWFGQGPERDYAYDGDVVYHEFSHAVVDKTLKLAAWHVDAFGAVDSPGAMNEGLADYFSSAITGDPDVGEYAAKDIGSGGAVIRTLANSDRCPMGVIGEVHADSTLFSGGLWQARKSLSEADRNKFDVAIYKAMRTNAGRGDLGYADLTNLFVATLKNDLPAGASALEAAMTERGVLPSCDRVIPFEGTPITSHEKRLGFAAPGLQSVSVKGVAPGLFQLQAKLPANTASVTITFAARAQQSGAAANPLTGNGKPFAPLVLAKLNKPIKWDPASKAGHDADLKGDVAASDSASITLDIPEGTEADSIYVQIASKGDTDGAYDGVGLAFTAREGEPPAEDPAAAAAPVTTTTTEGCAVVALGTNDGQRTFAFLSGILAAASLLMRRRRPTQD